MERDAVIVAGFGFRQGTALDSLREALVRTGSTPALLATVAGKEAELSQLAELLDLPIIAISKAEMARQKTLTRSEASLTAKGTGSVAEATALAAAGKGAKLLMPRQISNDRRATCAIAEGVIR